VLREGYELEEVQEQLKGVLLAHGREFNVPSSDQVLEHGRGEALLVGDLGVIR
jgi:hypothetical protein